MVNLLAGPKGSGKTQQMIELANQQAKECSGNVVFIKNSHRDTSSVTFDIRVVPRVARQVAEAAMRTGVARIRIDDLDAYERAVAERIQRDVLEQLKIKPLHVDGSPESRWMIVDFGNVMVHVFTKESRELYQLEDLWKDAPKVETIQKLEERIVASRLRQ